MRLNIKEALKIIIKMSFILSYKLTEKEQRDTYFIALVLTMLSNPLKAHYFPLKWLRKK